MNDIGFEAFILMTMVFWLLGALCVLYPLTEIFVQKVLWRSKKSVWQILKEII